MSKRAALKSADELSRIGFRQHRAGEIAGARRSYEAALVRDHAHVPTLTLLGTLSLEQGQHGRAVELLERAAALAPGLGVVCSNLGEALRRLGRSAEALTAFERAVALAPELAEAHYNLGLLLDQGGRLPEAITAYQAALSLDPKLPGALTTLLGALRDQVEPALAIACYRRLAPLAPDSAPLRCAIAGALLDSFRIDEALAHLQRALGLDPASALAHADSAIALAERGEIEAALRHVRRAIELEPGNALYQSQLVYLLAFSPRAEASEIGQAARDFGRVHAEPAPRRTGHVNGREPERRLRVGYVSPDFRAHASSSFLLPLLRAHDRSKVEIFCYSNARRADATTAAYRSLADAWREIAGLTDDAAAELIAGDAIDVLVDLSQHSAHHRLLLFARKPAPVQLSWLGYPGTTGVSAIDYRLSDPRLDPPELGDAHSTEQVMRLPDTFWCYDAGVDAPAVGDLPASSHGYVTFASLNSFKKANDRALSLWARVLQAVPKSRLLLVAPAGVARERVRAVALAHGVEPGRVELLAHLPRADYLRTYQRVDICLDPVPYSGGTTSLDAFWMGVPVVTLRGGTATSRATASLASSLQLPELIAESESDYVARAAALASDLPALAVLRAGLRQQFLASPLADVPRFARQLELGLRVAWRRWCDPN